MNPKTKWSSKDWKDFAKLLGACLLGLYSLCLAMIVRDIDTWPATILLGIDSLVYSLTIRWLLGVYTRKPLF